MEKFLAKVQIGKRRGFLCGVSLRKTREDSKVKKMIGKFLSLLAKSNINANILKIKGKAFKKPYL